MILRNYYTVYPGTKPCYQCGNMVNYLFSDGRGACCTREEEDQNDLPNYVNTPDCLEEDLWDERDE